MLVVDFGTADDNVVLVSVVLVSVVCCLLSLSVVCVSVCGCRVPTVHLSAALQKRVNRSKVWPESQGQCLTSLTARLQSRHHRGVRPFDRRIDERNRSVEQLQLLVQQTLPRHPIRERDEEPGRRGRGRQLTEDTNRINAHTEEISKSGTPV
jgi:hypothetical protein